MINSVTITNYLGDSITLELRFPEKSGFLIQEIAGLGPAKANINSTDLATGDGSVYNSARLNSRNIVLTLQLLEFPTVETMRQKSYKYFPVKKPLRLLFETENRICEIIGYVESNEPNIFSNMETTQISIICPNPYFYSAGPDGTMVTIFSDIVPEFKFPFSNESLTVNLLEMGTIISNQTKTVYYTGDSEIGIIITMHALGVATNVSIYNSEAHELMVIDTTRLATLTGSGIIAGDDIIISTIKGQKSITLLRDGVYTNILNCLARDTDWFQLVKGDNVFAFTADTGSTNLQIRIINQMVYEGV